MQRTERVGGVAVALLGGAEPPHGRALPVARVTEQEAEGTRGPRLARLGGDEIPAAGLLQLAALFQDGPEVQGGTPVAARGRLPVPLLGLADPTRPGSGDGAVVLAHGRPAPAGGGRLAVRSGAGTQSGAAERVVRVVRRVALHHACQPVRGFAVPLLGRGTQPALGADVAAVLQQVGEGVRAQRVALLGGLAQPVLGAGLVAALAVVAPEGVRGGGGAGDGRDPPPVGRLVRIPALMQEHAQVVGRGTVAVGSGRTQVGFGAYQVAPAQQQRAEDAHRRGVPGVGGTAVPRLVLGVVRTLCGLRALGVLHAVRGLCGLCTLDGRGTLRSLGGLDVVVVPCGGGKCHIHHVFRRMGVTLNKPPCLQQSCPVPHKYHRRTTCNPRTPGISRPVRSLQRFVDLPTERQVKHVLLQLVPRKPHFTPTAQKSHGDTAKARILERIRAFVFQ